MTTFGKRFKALRLENKITQNKLAEIFYLNKSSISRYESGNQIPESVSLQKFADYFNVSLDYLMGISDIRDSSINIFKIHSLNKEVERIMTFGDQLKYLRINKGITQQELADAMKVGRPTIAGYETKGKQPDYEKLAWLSNFFNVSIDYLLGHTDSDTLHTGESPTRKESDIAKGLDITIGRRIRMLRKEEHIPQKELAVILNISPTTLSMYESDSRIPSDDIKKKIANYFDVSLDYLMGISDVKASATDTQNSHLIKKEKLNISKDLNDIRQQLLSTNELFFDEILMDTASINSLLKVIELGIEIIRIKNKEKYKK